MPWKWWLTRIVGVALIVLGAALAARAQEPTGSVGVVPAVPNGSTPTALPGSTPAASAPVVASTAVPSSTAPAAATVPTAKISVEIPHGTAVHFTHVRHWYFPPRPAKPAKTPPAVVVPPAEPVRPTPQAPSKWFSFSRR